MCADEEVFARSREREQAHQSQGLFQRVGELNVLQVLAHHVSLVRAVRRRTRLAEKRVSQVTRLNRSIAAILVLTAVLHERDFVVPPHDVVPVRLVVFLELGIELKVLTNAHDDVFGRHSRVGLVLALVPLAFAEMECTHTKGDINDSTLFGSLVFRFNTGQLGILVTGQQKNTALGKLL